MTEQRRRTKIVATIGPACDVPGVVEMMVEAGVDVARLNGSHATPDEMAVRLARVRAAGDRAGRHVAVLLDLPGPKLRVGEMPEGVVLPDGAEFTLLAGEGAGDVSHAYVSYAGLAGDVKVGDRILIDDGSIELGVLRAGDGEVLARVMRGGPLTSHKGVNVPGVRLGVDSVGAHDLELLEWGLEAGVDLVAQSFVRSASDVETLRAAMGNRTVPLIAKIEKYEALSALAAIVAAADAIMVARGDLAVETSPEAVPPAQRRIVEACRTSGRPVIVATQMLESMVNAPRPTRAEASDVATAVFEGADAVMLSQETAVGRFPVEAVATMDRVCRSAEVAGPPSSVCRPDSTPTAAVAAAACDLASDVGAVAIVAATRSGASARAVAACRPSVPILALTPSWSTGRALTIVWGVEPQVAPDPASIEEMAGLARRIALASGAVRPGERFVLTAGTAVGVSGGTDLIRVLIA
jgi:pyruvate kinase